MFLLFFFRCLSLDCHGNADMCTSETVAKASARGTCRILGPLGIFCDSFANAVFLVWYFIFIMKFFCACHYALIWSLSGVLAVEKLFSDVWKSYSNPILAHASCEQLFPCFMWKEAQTTFTCLNCLAFSKVSYRVSKTLQSSL